jgi:PAS domain S-box-containing protein
VGSVAGLHWARTVNVARDANVPFYAGLDPFGSVPLAALELGLLFGGVGFLLLGDALVSLGGALLARLPVRVAAAVVWGLAAFASAVKVGASADEANLGQTASTFDSDLLRVAASLAALFAFHRVATLWRRPGPGAILATAVLAAVANYSALLEAGEIRRRGLVELFAHDHVESPSNYRHFFLESMLDHFAQSTELRRVMGAGAGPEQSNLAFIVWARSPLASVSAGCRVRIFDRDGTTLSTFSLGFPPELASAYAEAPATGRPATRFRREEIGSTRVDVYSGSVGLERDSHRLGAVELSLAYFDDLRGPGPALPSVFTNLTAPDEYVQFAREVPDRIDRYRGESLVYSTDPEGGLGKRVPSFLVQALAGSRQQGRWVERKIDDRLYDLYCVRERDGDVTIGYLTFGIERYGVLQAAGLLARSVLVTLVLGVLLLVALMAFAWAVPSGRTGRLVIPRPGFRERVIGGFLLVALLPTVLLGFAGRRLFVEEKRQEFQVRLEEDLRVSRELLGRRLADAARNAAGSDEVIACFGGDSAYRTLSTPRSVDGIVVMSDEGRLLGSSPSADLGMAIVPGQLLPAETAVEFFRRRGPALYSCAVVPVPPDPGEGVLRGGSVMAFQRIDPVLAVDLERRAGSAVSFFAGGLLTATSKPELYQSEILSDLAESAAYLKIELEGARRTVLESRVGETSFLASYAPLPDENGEPVGMLSTLAAFRGGGLDVEASRVLSRIYFVCLAVFAGAIGAAVVMASRLTRPISDLTVGAERIGAGRLGHEIATQAGGEIGALVKSFNLMSRRLAAAEVRDRERREYIEAIIRHVGSGVISFDSEGRVATVNEAAARIVSRDAAALVGRRPGEVEGGEALAAVLRAARPLLAGERADVEEEIEVEGSGGEDDELRSIRLVGTPLVDREGTPQGAVIVFEDLTDLIRSKKIKAWAEMARQVAHEIKNPLTPMKLSAQHVLQAWKDRHPKFDEILRESAETIVDRCEALRRIAVEFSDYARMPGRHVRREDLGRLLREARRLYGEAEGRPVEFTLDAPEDCLYTRVDKDEVMRLFINLIENSFQAMPEGGRLDVRAWGSNGSAHVTIQDTGSGITGENLARIFEPSFSTKTGGAGLGLPICKAIMEDYGGTIAIQSRPGEGTTVTLVFPAEDARTG